MVGSGTGTIHAGFEAAHVGPTAMCMPAVGRRQASCCGRISPPAATVVSVTSALLSITREILPFAGQYSRAVEPSCT